MGNLFSGGKKKDKQKITPRDRAILDLKVQRDRLKQYQKKINSIMERETEIAKLHLTTGQRDLALLALRKKKYQESLLESTATQLINIEQQTMTIEFAMVEQQVFEGLQRGNEVLAELQQELSLEDVEKLMADTAEAIAYQQEVSALLSGRLTEEEEEDLEAELAQMQSEALETMLPKVPLATQPAQEAEEAAPEAESSVEDKGRRVMVVAE